jgi:TENA/THI-4/PQQC family protein
MNFHDRYHQNNNNFIEKMTANFSKIIDAIITHPYISALEKKEISREKLEVFVCEQYHIIANDRKNFAFIISKASDEISTDLFFDCLSAEVKALKNLALMAEELGVSKGKIESYEPLAGCHAYTKVLTEAEFDIPAPEYSSLARSSFHFSWLKYNFSYIFFLVEHFISFRRFIKFHRMAYNLGYIYSTYFNKMK